MSHLTKGNQSFFHFLTSCNPRQQQLLLETMTPQQVCALCDATRSFMTWGLPLKKREIDDLRVHKKHLFRLVDDSVPYKEKKKVLVQHGAGFVDQLLKPVLTALAYATL